MALHRPLQPRDVWEEVKKLSQQEEQEESKAEGAATEDQASRRSSLSPIIPPGALTTFEAACASSERPERVTATWALLEENGMVAGCRRVLGREATEAELSAVHTTEHVAAMLALQGECIVCPPAEEDDGDVSEVNGGSSSSKKPEQSSSWQFKLRLLKEQRLHNYVFMNEHTVRAARLAAGSVVEACIACLPGGPCHGRGAACVVRPPGHHSEAGCCMGFGFFNSVAVAAQAFLNAWGARNATATERLGGEQRRPRVEPHRGRVLIVDWDVHHGNGSQEIFYERDDVLYVSLHRWDQGFFYPGAYFDAVGRAQIGGPTNVGRGAGLGHTANIAWMNGLTGVQYGDAEYVHAFQRVVLPLARAFAPDLVLVSAGFDAARGDPEGELDVTPEGYCWMTRALMGACPSVVVVLEGGYNVVSVKRSMEACLGALLGVEAPRVEKEPCAEARADVEAAVAALRPYWELD